MARGLLVTGGLPRRRRTSGGHGIVLRVVLMNFCLILGLLWFCSCLLAPAALVSSAAVSGAAVLAEIERLAHDGGNSDVVTVTAEANLYEGPGKNYRLKGVISKGDQIRVLGMTGDGIQCSCGPYEIGWVQQSNVSE